MSIQYVRYLQDMSSVSVNLPRIEAKDATDLWVQHWPSGSWRDDLIQEYLDSGNVIQEYDKYFGWPLENIKLHKMREGELYGREVVREAYRTPYVGSHDINTAIYREKEQSKRRLRSDKKALAMPLTSQEQVELARAEAMQSYEVLCIECSNEFNELVDTMTDKDELALLDPATAVIWPVWTPPA